MSKTFMKPDRSGWWARYNVTHGYSTVQLVIDASSVTPAAHGEWRFLGAGQTPVWDEQFATLPMDFNNVQLKVGDVVEHIHGRDNVYEIEAIAKTGELTLTGYGSKDNQPHMFRRVTTVSLSRVLTTAMCPHSGLSKADRVALGNRIAKQVQVLSS